jgi:amidase
VAHDAIDPFTPAVELAAAVRRKDVSPVELVDLYLDRMDRLDGRLNAYCHRADDEVRTARSSSSRSLFNVSGLPAISVPIHHDHATGLPVGVQIVAGPLARGPARAGGPHLGTDAPLG